MDSCERGWGPSQSEQEEADRPRRGVSPRQGVPCSAAVTAVGEQRHRILSRDGEAARQILVPQIDFTLLSPSGGGDTNLPALCSRSLARPVGAEWGPVWAKKAARTLEIPDSGQGVPKQPSNFRNGREKPGFEAPGAPFFRAREGVDSLDFRPSSQARHSLSRKAL